MRAMLTRDDDYFVPLATRVQKARRVQADLFVSIHADAFREPTRARLVGVRAVRARRDQRCGELARAEGELGRSDRRRQPRHARPGARAHAARPARRRAQISDSLKVGPPGAGRHRRDQRAAQGRGRAGRIRGAEGARHSVDPGRDRVHLQSRRGTEAAQRPAPGAASPSRCTTASAAISRRIRRSRAIGRVRASARQNSYSTCIRKL